MRARKLVELAGLAWLLLGSLAQAQQVVRPYTPLPSSPSPADVSPFPGPTGSVQLLPPDAPFVPIAMQQPRAGAPGDGARDSDQAAIQEISIQLEPPRADRLFRLESEYALRERMRQEARQRNPPEKITFPEDPILTTDKFGGRHWPPIHMVVEPNFVPFQRLYFHQINFERYGWDVGPVSTVLAGMVLFKDLVLFPYHAFTDPLRDYDYSNGWCLPGDPVPLLLYPEPLSATGLLGEAAAVALVLITFP